MKILFGLLLIGAGIVAIYYSKNCEKWFGKWQWAENNLGGTAQAYVIGGFLLIVLGVMSLFAAF